MRYPWFSEAVKGENAALRTRRQVCAGRPGSVLGAGFRGYLRRDPGRHRPQWIGQNLAAAADRGPADAGGRIDRSRRGGGGGGPARTGPLSRPSRRVEAGFERAGKFIVLAGFSRRRGVRAGGKPDRGGPR